MEYQGKVFCDYQNRWRAGKKEGAGVLSYDRVLIYCKKQEVAMPTTVKQQIIKEVEEMPHELQEKMLKLVHFMKKELLAPRKKRLKGANALLDVDKITIDTGISDFSYQHDHYLYDVPKK